MKQNITDGQSKPHLPAQIQLVTSSMKQKQPDGIDGGYINHSVDTHHENGHTLSHANGIVDNSPASNELRLRRNLTSDDHHQHDDQQRKVSMNSIDLADMIKKQQESLHQIASQHQTDQFKTGEHLDLHLTNGGSNGNAVMELHITKLGSSESNGRKDSSITVPMAPESSMIPNGTSNSGSDMSNDSEKTNPEDDKKEKWSNIRRLLAGVALTILSAFFFSITTVIVKFVTDIKPSQMALFRYIGILVLSFPVMLESRENWFGENNWWWRLWMLLRGLSGCTSLFFRYSAVTYISLADTTIIMLSMPVFVFIFARIFLKEQFGRYHVLALCLSLVGIAFASKIDILFKKDDSSNIASNVTTTLMPDSLYNNETISTTMASTTVTPSHEASSTYHQVVGSLFALGAMLIGSLVYIMVRKMRKTHHSVILFNFAIISIVEMSLINYIFYDFHLPTTGYSAYLITVLAVFSFYGQLLLTKAIQIEEAGVVSVVRVSGEAFFAFLFQIIIFGEMPDVYTITGAILVLTAVFLLSFRKYVISLPDSAPLKKKFHFLTK